MSAFQDAAGFLPELERFLVGRLRDAPDASYSHSLMTDSQLVRRKIMEEAFEVCLEIEAPTVDSSRLAEEAADLVFHLLCGLVGAGVEWSEVEDVLVSRHRGASS